MGGLDRAVARVHVQFAHAQHVEDGLAHDLPEDGVLLVEPLARVERQEEL